MIQSPVYKAYYLEPLYYFITMLAQMAERAPYHDEICVYVEHSLAGRDIQYLAPDSRSRCTTPFDDMNEMQPV